MTVAPLSCVLAKVAGSIPAGSTSYHGALLLVSFR